MRQIQAAPGQNFLAGLSGGLQAGQQVRQVNDQNALRNIFANEDINNPAVQKQIMALDPQMGMQLQDQTYQRGRQAKADARADQTFEMKVKEHALTLSAAERAQKAAEVRQAVTPAIVAHRQGPDAFKAYVTQNAPAIAETLQAVGIDPTTLTYENAPQAMSKIEGIAEVFEAADDMVPEAPEPLSAQGKLMADLQAGRITQEQFNAANQKSGMRVSATPDGGFVFEQGVGVAGSGRPPTEGQLAGAGYLQRMTGAEEIIRGLEDSGFTAIPIAKALALDTKAEGYVLSPQEASLAQAQRDWVRAKLRKESGAVIADEEMASEIKTYFPMPGEGPDIVAQKRKARARAERQMQIGAGSAAPMAGGLSDAENATSQNGENPFANITPEQFVEIDIMSLLPGEQKQLLEAMGQ